MFLVFWAGKPDGQRAKAKVMEKNFVSVNDHLWAGKYEVTNIAYLEFLATLKDNPARYKELNVNGNLWDEALAFSDPVKENYFTHPAFHEYPVVNVSYEGAKAYCAWFTEIYHTDAKRKYEKVIFRLPTAKEWEEAASAGNENASYPWGGPYLRNAKGQYLCNFRVIPQHAITKDGDNNLTFGKDAQGDLAARDNYLITAPVDAFVPNDLGMFNASGNVAEMTATEGIAKGGSWADTGYDVRIQSEKEFTQASPKVGFRVFMEVIEP
jgi:formylglycine-generating enzyme required for sulfatase activity